MARSLQCAGLGPDYLSLRTPLNLDFFFWAMNWPPSLFRFVNVFFPMVLVASCERFLTAPLRALSPIGLFVAMTYFSPLWLWIGLNDSPSAGPAQAVAPLTDLVLYVKRKARFPLGRERFGGKVTDIHLRPWLASLRDLRLLCDKQKPAGETSGVIRRRKGWVIVESIYQNDRRCAASVPSEFQSKHRLET
jgi:hypothetical protein